MNISYIIVVLIFANYIAIIAWWHQAIAWTSVDLLSVRSGGMYLGKLSYEGRNISLSNISLDITFFNSHPDILEAT